MDALPGVYKEDGSDNREIIKSMEYNLVTSLQSCVSFIEDGKAAGVVGLVYYSHIPTAIIALLFGMYVFLRNRKSLVTKILLMLSVAFACWTFFDLMTWISHDSRVTMFSWSLLGMFNVLIFLISLYLIATFPKEKDVSLRKKIAFSFFLLPILVLTPLSLNLYGFDAVNCEAMEDDWFVNSYYFLSLVLFLCIFFVFVRKFRSATVKSERQEIFLLGFGTMFFLATFSLMGFFASFFDSYKFEFYGLFGMTVFLVFLGYLVVRFKAFDIKLLGVQALVIAQFILIGSMLTAVQGIMNYILICITLLFTLGAGWALIRSVKKEVARKEELQKISDSLALANERLQELDNAKSEFISIASHQLRTPLTAIKGYVSLILEGSYGKIDSGVQDVLNKVYTVQGHLTQLVEDLLNVSRIEAGRIKYNYTPIQIEVLVADLVDMFLLSAKNKQLALGIRLQKKSLPKLLLDENKIKEVFSNLIDNAIKYTEQGTVTVSVEGGDNVVRVTVEDTGIGIKPEDKIHLFEKFVRSKETAKMVTSGTGLGLYVGKNFVEAHGGRIWVESEGIKRGARFIVELPFTNPNAGKSEITTFKESYKKETKG